MSNTFDHLNRILLELVTVASEGAAYKTWDDTFARKEVREVWADQNAPLRKRRGFKFSVAELSEMTSEEMNILGFGNWDGTLRLIPLWAINYVKDGEELTSISGEKVKKDDSLDLDVRFGCIAFGFNKN